MRQNKITDGDLSYNESLAKGSVFPYNLNEGCSCCIVIPFSIKEGAMEVCKEELKRWAFDEILIEEEDYKQLLEKSNKLRLVNSLGNKDGK